MFFYLILFSLFSFKAFGQMVGDTYWTLGCPPFQYHNASFQSAGIIEQALFEVDNILEYLVGGYNLSSISYGIVYNQDLIYYKGLGYTNISGKIKPNKNSIYRIGSVSKLFTTIMAYILRDKEIINLDDSIYKLNKNFNIINPWGVNENDKYGQTLTIRQLLSQMSGLPRESPCDINTTTIYGDICQNFTTNDILNNLKTMRLIHPTDVQPSYSNLAFALVGNIISEYYGTDFVTALQELILDNLNLENTGVYLNNNQIKYASVGYNSDGSIADWVDLGWESPAGSLFSSVNDLSIILKQIFASIPGKYEQFINNNYPFLINPQSYREMLRPIILNSDLNGGFGTPWELQVLNNKLLRTKGGNINGFSANIAFVPEMRLGVIALINEDIDASIITQTTLQVLTPHFDSYLTAMESQYPPNLPDNWENFLGYYLLDNQILFEIVNVTLNYNLWLMVWSTSYDYGALIWIGYNETTHISEFYFSQVNPTESCWSETLIADKGDTVKFQLSDDGSKVLGAIIDDAYYGYFFTRYDSNNDNDNDNKFEWKNNLAQAKKYQRERSISNKNLKIIKQSIKNKKTKNYPYFL